MNLGARDANRTQRCGQLATRWRGAAKLLRERARAPFTPSASATVGELLATVVTVPLRAATLIAEAVALERCADELEALEHEAGA